MVCAGSEVELRQAAHQPGLRASQGETGRALRRILLVQMPTARPLCPGPARSRPAARTRRSTRTTRSTRAGPDDPDPDPEPEDDLNQRRRAP
jgi:hypothetical protein